MIPLPHPHLETRTWRQPALYLLTIVFTALTLFRAPAPLTFASQDNAYRAYLYESIRLGHVWGRDILTNDGPLAALQIGLYSGGSVWMWLLWQIAGNILIAIVFVSTAWCFAWKTRLWILGFFLVIAARIPEFAPWISLGILGYVLCTQESQSKLRSFTMAMCIGILGLSSIAHFVLGLISLLLVLIASRFSKSSLSAAIGWTMATLLGWLMLGQPLPGLVSWLATAPSLAFTTSKLFRYHDLSTLPVWALLVTIAVFATFFLSEKSGKAKLNSSLFLSFLLLFAWKGIALQPFGEPVLFFGSGLFAAGVLLYRGAATSAAVIISLFSLGGIANVNSLIFVDGIGHLNRQSLTINLPNLFRLSSLRTQAKNEFNNYRPLYAQPRLISAIAGATVNIVGESPAYAYYNDIKLSGRSVPMFLLARTPFSLEQNGHCLMAASGPAYVIQRVTRRDEILPPIEDALAQLALYRNYSIDLEENGFLLWKRKNHAPSIPERVLVASGEIIFGKPLTLPVSPPPENVAYWLEIDLRPNLVGRLWALVDEVSEPGVLVQDQNNKYFYVLPYTLASNGFLLSPFFRGEADLIRQGTEPTSLKVSQITLLPPSCGTMSWGQSFTYRLYALSPLAITGNLSAANSFKNRYNIFNRLPVAIRDYFTAQNIPLRDMVALTAHPENEIELALVSTDKKVQGKYGISEGAYQNENGTDGVDFSIELIGDDGVRKTLFHRWLNPMTEVNDRGLQTFELNLPPRSGGRLVLHTYNPPERGPARDWAYWADVSIK